MPPEPVTAHATAVAIGEAGILIRGPSGSGKSSLAMMLMESGGEPARLVADDQVILTVKEGRLAAAVPRALAGLLEVRGLGIVHREHVSPVVIRLCVDLAPLAEIPRLPERADRFVAFGPIRLPRMSVSIGSHDSAVRVRMALRELELASWPSDDEVAGLSPIT
jgi:serine kinase of HPr protein (carbohydrate metabolism regulator)